MIPLRKHKICFYMDSFSLRKHICLSGQNRYIGDFKVFKLLLKQSLFLDSRSVVSVGDDLVAI